MENETWKNTKFVHLRVNDGGHQWYGSSLGDWLTLSLGYNNHDISANEELVNFFFQYKLSDFNTPEGDLNHDETINILDVVLLVNMVLGAEETDDSGDFNNDRIINVLDIIMLMNIVLQG